MSAITISRSSLGRPPNYILSPGELFLDMKNGLLYWKDVTNTQQVIPFTASGIAGLSSAAINAAVALAISNVVSGAPATMDTLKELADALGDDPTAYVDIMTSISSLRTAVAVVSNCIRFDTAQSLTAAQQSQATQNVLGFYPVQMGTGVGQTTGYIVKIGWSSGGKLLAAVDSLSLGSLWSDGASPFNGQSNGYIQLPNGYIRQWGLLTIATTDGTITWIFPEAFTANIFDVTITPIIANNGPGLNNYTWSGQIKVPSLTSVGIGVCGIRYSDNAFVNFPTGNILFVTAEGY